MGCRNFRPSATIDELQSRDRTALVIGTQDDLSEDAVTHDAGCQELRTLSALLKHKRRLVFEEAAGWRHRIDPRKRVFCLIQPQHHDATEIAWRKRPYRRLGAPGNSPTVVEQPALYHTFSVAEGNRIGKVEIAARLDKREKHALCAGIRDDLLHLGNSEVSLGIGNLARLVVDNPIADTGLHPAEILRRELIPFCRTVVVDRIRSVNEDPVPHSP